MSHRPTPWETGHTHGGALGIWSAGCKADEPDICRIASVASGIHEANAALIVRAVNSHALLVEACQTVLDLLDNRGPVAVVLLEALGAAGETKGT